MHILTKTLTRHTTASFAQSRYRASDPKKNRAAFLWKRSPLWGYHGNGNPGELDDYPLVNIQTAIENGHRNSGFSRKKMWFSIVMLVYQRVLSMDLWNWHVDWTKHGEIVRSQLLGCEGGGYWCQKSGCFDFDPSSVSHVSLYCYHYHYHYYYHDYYHYTCYYYSIIFVVEMLLLSLLSLSLLLLFLL